MAAFIDRKGQSWRVELDAPLIEKVRDLHQVNLTNLEADPLLKLRNDPMILVAILYLICEDEIAERGLTPEQFAKSLPSPPDHMLEAVAEAIVNFYPTGRHSHVREVLARYQEMSEVTDAIARTKMAQILKDPKTATRLSSRADKEFDRVMEEMFPLNSEAGT